MDRNANVYPPDTEVWGHEMEGRGNEMEGRASRARVVCVRRRARASPPLKIEPKKSS